MTGKRAFLIAIFVLEVLALGPITSMIGNASASHEHAMPTDPHCVSMGQELAGQPVSAGVPPVMNVQPHHLTHPCNSVLPMWGEPPFAGVSPLSITYVPSIPCTADPYSAGFGDITVWQANGHSYVGISGFARVMFHIFNVDDPYNPQLLITVPFPASGTASTSIYAFRQGNNHYLSDTMRGSGSGCGYFIYNVNDPSNPQLLTRKSGADWCTVHEHYVSTDANGNADYAWLTMSSEAGSGTKIVVLDMHDMNNIVETGRYQRPDNAGFAHDSNVVGDRAFVADWDGGLLIHDKETLAHNTNPTPLNPLDSIRPANFSVHHVVPTTDGNHVFVEDEFNNTPSEAKLMLYNISNVAAPYFETQITSTGVYTTANNRAHNMRIMNLSPGHDLLLDGWYEAGTRGFEVDTTGPSPVITQTLFHQLRQSTDGQFGNVWGVDYLPCTVKGQPVTCLYTSDMNYGLVVDALGYNPLFDPYNPESQITDPMNGQNLTKCAYTIQGNAHDYYSGVAQIEVSTDNGSTWHPAQGTTNWTYQWSIPADGTYTLKVRARDVAGNVGSPTMAVTVTVNGGCVLITPTPPMTFTPLPVTDTPVPPTNTSVVPTSTPMPASATPVEPTETPQIVIHTPTATAISTACSIEFNDVPPTNPFYSYIQCLACRGIISGYADGTFRPGNNVTRGQTAKIVANAAGLSGTPSGQTFTDVPPNNPFYTYIELMYAAGYINGYNTPAACPTGVPCFHPYSDVTRGQLAKIDANAARYNEQIPPSQQTFSDVPPSSQPFWLWIERVALHGVISGYNCGTPPAGPCDPQRRPYFLPGNTATRGQTAKIVANSFPGCAIRR